jgi:hypothetical protein
MQRSMHSDASKVKIKGTGITKAFRNQKSTFTVDTRDAGLLSFLNLVMRLFIYFLLLFIFVTFYYTFRQ